MRTVSRRVRIAPKRTERCGRRGCLRRPAGAPAHAPRQRLQQRRVVSRPRQLSSMWLSGTSNTLALGPPAASSRCLRGRDELVAGGQHDRRSACAARPSHGPRVKAAELTPGLGDVAGRVAHQLGLQPRRRWRSRAIPARRKPQPVGEPGGEREREAERAERLERRAGCACPASAGRCRRARGRRRCSG